MAPASATARSATATGRWPLTAKNSMRIERVFWTMKSMRPTPTTTAITTAVQAPLIRVVLASPSDGCRRRLAAPLRLKAEAGDVSPPTRPVGSSATLWSYPLVRGTNGEDPPLTGDLNCTGSPTLGDGPSTCVVVPLLPAVASATANSSSLPPEMAGRALRRGKRCKDPCS